MFAILVFGVAGTILAPEWFGFFLSWSFLMAALEVPGPFADGAVPTTEAWTRRAIVGACCVKAQVIG